MTDTPTETGEETPNPAEPLQDALVAFTACMANAVPDICSYGLTIGESYVPFDPDDDEDCTEEDVMCSQLWVRVTNITPTAINSEGFDGQQCDVSLDIGLEVGILRCIEVPEGGEAPKTADVLAAAMQAISDMNAIQCAALNCKTTKTQDGETYEVETFGSVDIGQWSPLGPLGGQYGGVWTFTVEL